MRRAQLRRTHHLNGPRPGTTRPLPLPKQPSNTGNRGSSTSLHDPPDPITLNSSPGDKNTMSFVITPPKAAGIPGRGSVGFFPVHRIYCVGRNYAAHTIEMGHDPDREDPFFFQKNPDNLVTGGGAFPYPPRSNDVHHEIELAVALGKGGKDIPLDKALDHVWGYGVALDMTRRDLQGDRKSTRLNSSH